VVYPINKSVKIPRNLINRVRGKGFEDFIPRKKTTIKAIVICAIQTERPFIKGSSPEKRIIFYVITHLHWHETNNYIPFDKIDRNYRSFFAVFEAFGKSDHIPTSANSCSLHFEAVFLSLF
jgi:hypothetical protein